MYIHVDYFNANIIEILYSSNKFKLFQEIILDLRYQNRATKQVAHYEPSPYLFQSTYT